MSWIALTPSDVWLFRDGRPFDAGSDHRARSLFPPNPTTLQGALRSAILLRSGASLAEYASGEASCRDAAARQVSAVIGWPEESPRFTLAGPFLARRDGGTWRPLFPVPADLVKLVPAGQRDQERVDTEYIVLAPLRNSPFMSGWPDEGLVPLWRRRDVPVKEADGWLGRAAIDRWLACGVPADSEIVREDQLFARESRFGIALDERTRRPAEGLLYSAEFIRPREDAGLLIEVQGVDLARHLGETGVIALGGEARAARYDIVDEVSLPAARCPDPDADGETRVKLYLATPAWFAHGWRPEGWDRWIRGTGVRLVTAAVAHADVIGGARVDLKSQRDGFQRPARRFVPAGSVFYLEVDGPAQYTGEPLTDLAADAHAGFGRTLVGRWDYA